jgi:hypothetical protein
MERGKRSTSPFSLPIRSATGVGTRVALQRGPILRQNLPWIRESTQKYNLDIMKTGHLYMLLIYNFKFNYLLTFSYIYYNKIYKIMP